LKTLTAATLGLAALMLASTAVAQTGKPNVLVYGVVGTTGLGIGFGTQASPYLAFRGELSRYTRSYTTTENNIDYRGDVKLQAGAVYADFRPFGGVFRVTAGLDFNTPRANVRAQPNGLGLVEVNGVPYPVLPGESINGDIRFRSTSPYLGIGWGLSNLDRPGPRFGLDLGVNIGKARGKLTATDGLRALPGFNENLAAESNNFNNDVSSVKAYPVLKVAVGYAF